MKLESSYRNVLLGKMAKFIAGIRTGMLVLTITLPKKFPEGQFLEAQYLQESLH